MTRERWSTQHDGRTHEVRVDSRLGSLAAEWRVDGVLVARGRERDKELVLVTDDAHDPTLGAVGVQAPMWLGVTRRVVLLPGDAVGLSDEDDEDDDQDVSPEHDLRVEARLHLVLSFNRGTIDLAPEPGSRAAARLDRIARHPRLHVLWSALTGGGVVVPLLLLGVLIEVLEPYLPQGPNIEVPNISVPSLPLPDWDLPSVPFPDLPDTPDWVGTTLKLLLAISVATVVARGEAERWRKRRSPEPGDTDADADADADEQPELTES